MWLNIQYPRTLVPIHVSVLLILVTWSGPRGELLLAKSSFRKNLSIEYGILLWLQLVICPWSNFYYIIMLRIKKYSRFSRKSVANASEFLEDLFNFTWVVNFLALYCVTRCEKVTYFRGSSAINPRKSSFPLKINLMYLLHFRKILRKLTYSDNKCVLINCNQYQWNISSRFSSDSEEDASELLTTIILYSDIFRSQSSTTQ